MAQSLDDKPCGPFPSKRAYAKSIAASAYAESTSDTLFSSLPSFSKAKDGQYAESISGKSFNSMMSATSDADNAALEYGLYLLIHTHRLQLIRSSQAH